MAVVRIPTAKVTLALGGKEKDLVFASGVTLVSCSVQVGEQDRSNTCQITFADPGLEIAAKLRARSIAAGGIAAPKNLYEKDETVAGAASTVPASSKNLPKDGNPGSNPTAYIGGTVEVSLSAEYRAYLDLIAWCEGSSFNTIVGFDGVITDFSRHPAKLVASAGSDAAGRYQFLSTTWKGLGLSDFSPKNQDLGAKKLIEGRGAAGAVSRGLSGLDEFLEKCSYEWASLPPYRYPGQGTKTSAQCRDFLGKALSFYKSGGITGSKSATPIGPAAPTPSPSNTDEIPKDAIELSVELGWSDRAETIAFQFWYTSHSLSTPHPQRTTISGKGIRFLMNIGSRDRKTYRNISLRQVAQRLGSKYGIDTEVPSTPASEKIVQYLNQSGQTDYQFLLAIANASGFLLQEETKGDKKTIKLVAASSVASTQVKVARSWGATFKSDDSASAERILKALPSISTIADDKAVGDGYSTSLEMSYPSIETMKLQPGAIVVIPKNSIAGLPADSAFCREYRLKSNAIAYEGGTFKQTLELYIPVNQEPKKEQGKGDANKPVGEQGAKGGGVPPKRDGKFLFLSATGTKNEAGLNVLELAYYNNGTKQASYPAISGAPGAQDLSKVNVSGSYAPCPPSLTGYQLANPAYAPGGLGPGLGKYWVEVLGTNGRGGIGIHQDTGAIGTAGCIGLSSEADAQAIYELYSLGVRWIIIDYKGWIP